MTVPVPTEGGCEDADGLGHVMHALEGDDEIVGAFGFGGVLSVELDAVADTASGGVLGCASHGGGIEVVAIDGDVWVALGDADGGPAHAAADIGDASARLLKAGVEIGELGEVLGGELVEEHGSVRVALRFAHVVAVVVPGDAGAGA